MESATDLDLHHAHVIAAKLRARGVFAAGKDVQRWSGPQLATALAWLARDNARRRAVAWNTFTGGDVPPTRPHSWPQVSAQGREPGRRRSC